MPFGIGASASSSSSESQSTSFDNLDSSSFSVGESGSSSASTGISSSTDRIAFQDLFQNLFGGASQAAGGINTTGLSGAANDLFGSGGDFLSKLQGGGAGGGFLEDQLANRDDLANQQVDLLGGDINKFLTESVIPGIDSTGIQAGTFGGGRGAVARGIAGEGATREFARGATAIRQGERDRTTGIASTLLGENTRQAQAGIGGLSSVFGLAEAGQFAELSPFAALAQIMGGPTTLTDSSSISEALAQSFGFDAAGSISTGRAGSQSTSESESASASFNVGI